MNQIKQLMHSQIMKKALFFVICTLYLSPAVAQQTLRGRVIDASTGHALEGAIVSSNQIKGYSSLTDEEGRYEIIVPDYCSALSFSAPDFETAILGIGGQTTMPDVSLYPTIPTAYSPSSLTIEEDIQRQLSSQVYTISRSGTPAIGSVMFIDGLNSINANAQPLIVVDGVIFDQQRSKLLLHSGFYNDLLAGISPADIERVTVLRNGTSLYGAKGSNGVILIETRRNKSMATRITASVSAGVTLEPRFINMMNAEQYRSYASELLKTTHTTAKDFKFLNEDPTYYYYRQYHNETDWREGVYRTAFTQNYGINIEGGDAVANYNLSLGYVNAQSTLDYNNMNRLNVRFNTDINFSDKFHTRFDASFSNLGRNLRDDGTPASYTDGPVSSPSFLAYAKSPFLSPYAYAGGNLSGHLDVNDETYLDEALAGNGSRLTGYGSPLTGYSYKLANPYALNVYGDAENKNRFQNAMLNIAVMPSYKFNACLSLREHFSYNLVSTNEKYYIPVYGVPDYYVQSLASTRQNEVRSLFSRQNSVMSDTRLQWSHRFDAHHFNAFGGVRINWENISTDNQLSYNTGNDKTPFTQSGPDSRADGSSDNWTNIAWYAQLQYDYLQRYDLQFNITAETSSDFGIDAADGLKAFGARWGLFPGMQLGWVISNEPWFRTAKGGLQGKRGGWLNYLRLHAGFDMTGNSDINHLAARSYFKSERYLDAVLGLNLGNIGNSRIQWECTRKLTLGLDSRFLAGRLSLSLNFFSSTTDNLLTLQSLSYLTGLQTNWSNGGTMTNKGIDASLGGRLITTRDWQWDVNVSMGHYKNKITELPGDQGFIDSEYYGATVRTAVGQAANVFYGYQTKGVFATSEQAAATGLYVLADNGVDRNYFKAGDMWFADLDGNGRIDQSDRTVIGNPNPDIYGNISSHLCWKRLSLLVQLNYAMGNDIYNYQRSQLEGGQRFMNQTTAMTRRWHGEGHLTDIPRITFQDPMGNARFSDRWIEDGSYLRLKSVTLSYRLPVNSQFLQGLEFWVQGNNLFTFTRYLGADPETAITGSVIGQGIDIGLLPQSRSFLAGVKINL